MTNANPTPRLTEDQRRWHREIVALPALAMFTPDRVWAVTAEVITEPAARGMGTAVGHLTFREIAEVVAARICAEGGR